MSIKTISSDYSAGYSLAAQYTGVSITGTGEVTNAPGATGTAGTSTSNGGAGGTGKRALAMPRGGLLLNHGSIFGGAGGAGGAGYGTTENYHFGTGGGAGGAGGLAATLSGYGSITNYGWLSGGAGGGGGDGGGGGVGGSGGAGGAGGAGGNGLVGSLGANLDNLGTLSGGAGGNAGGGSANGAAGGAGGVGGFGVSLKSARQLTNQGVIQGGSGGSGGGEYSQYPGPGGNGGYGGAGVIISLAGTIANAGVIAGGSGGHGGPGFGPDSFSGNGGNGGQAIDLNGGGVLTNSGTVEGGAGGDAGTYYGAIGGFGGAGGGGVFFGGRGTVTNLGTIEGGAGGKAYMINAGPEGIGIQLDAGGIVVNGSSSNNAAVISGYVGIRLYADGQVTNYGVIDCLSGGLSGFAGTPAGIQLFDGGTVRNFGTIAALGGGQYYPANGVNAYKSVVTNGAAASHGALIEGYVGLRGGGGTTIDNFATIQGTGGIAVSLTASDRLIAESGSKLIGLASGGGGTLELGAAAGTISGLGATGTVSGDETMTFSGFATYVLDGGGQWTLSGANNVGEGASLTIDQGATLTVRDLLGGAGGTLDVAGTEVIVAGGGIGVQNWMITGGTTDFAGIETFTATFQETGAATLTLSTGSHLWLTGTTVLSGVVSGAGTLQVTTASTAGLTVAGTAILEVSHSFSQTGMITVGGASGNATVEINHAAVWSLDGNSVARGASGLNRILDVGRLVANGGSSVVDVAISDYGVVEADGGVLSLSQSIYGTGSLMIDAGATLNVRAVGSLLKATFSGANATLALNEPRKFGATISGFGSTDNIDLIRIKATGASVNAADQLIIVNGATTVATLQLAGNYAGATFSAGSDGGGGTDISLVSAASVRPSPNALIGAMATLGSGASSIPTVSPPVAEVSPMLLVPGHS